MSRDDFLNYLALWEKRAQNLGAEKINFNDLHSKQFAVSVSRDKFMDMLNISMGPTRRASARGLWCDTWTAFFTMNRGSQNPEVKPELLSTLSAFRDEFNTVARTN